MCFAPQRRALFRHFFHIGTSKSGPRPSVFYTFDLEMCFAPQRRALFRHRNFQKSSDTEVFSTFSLRNVLRATTACTFLTSQLPKVVRRWGVLYILTWKCASRHNGVHFFIAPVASWLRTRRFSEPTFRPSWATNHWKNTVFRDFPTFSRICIFCPLTLSLLLFSLLIFLFSLPLPYSAFHLSILSEVWLLNFLRSVYISLCISVYISLCISVYISCIMLCVIVCPFQLVFIREPRLRLPHWVPHKTAHRVEVRPRKFCRPPSAICKHQTCTEIWDIVRHCVTIIFKIHQNYP